MTHIVLTLVLCLMAVNGAHAALPSSRMSMHSIPTMVWLPPTTAPTPVDSVRLDPRYFAWRFHVLRILGHVPVKTPIRSVYCLRRICNG